MKILIKFTMLDRKANDFLRIVFARIQGPQPAREKESKFKRISHVERLLIIVVICLAFPGYVKLSTPSPLLIRMDRLQNGHGSRYGQYFAKNRGRSLKIHAAAVQQWL